MPEQPQSPEAAARPTHRANAVPKLLGSDVEMGNFILGLDQKTGTGDEASRALMHEVIGVRQYGGAQSGLSSQPSSGGGSCCGGYGYSAPGYGGYGYGANYGYGYGSGGKSASTYNALEWGRKFLPSNAGSIYVDMSHLELVNPEVLSAHDYVAAWHAMLIIAREALDRANARMPHGRKIQVLANNTDGLGDSWGSHFNVMISREAYDNIFARKLHHMLYLASYLTSSIVFTGAGKVGSENGRPPVDFQLSQRADFYETLTGVQTTYNRPLVNSRDESLCGSSWYSDRSGTASGRLARLHVIFFDNALCPVTCLLKAGVTQIMLAMIEQQYIAPELLLDNPLAALTHWSRDPSLRATARLISRARYTAVDMQEAILAKAAHFVEKGRVEGIVPRAQEILSCWAETLGQLKHRDWPALAPKLDWVLKRCVIERAMASRGLAWAAPEVKLLDQMYSSLDLNEGIFWSLERSGLVQQVVSKAEIERFVHEPPEDTRAWLRAQLLRRADPAEIEDVDWDVMRFRFRNSEHAVWPSYSYLRLDMSDPLRFTRSECESLFADGSSLQEIVKLLGGTETNWSGQPMAGNEGTLPTLLPLPLTARAR
jgi:proteasome accessory factor A